MAILGCQLYFAVRRRCRRRRHHLLLRLHYYRLYQYVATTFLSNHWHRQHEVSWSLAYDSKVNVSNCIVPHPRVHVQKVRCNVA